MKTIQKFSDFVEDLQEAGFSIGGENSEGIFALSEYFGDEIHWHWEDPETDPWEWRMRVLHERQDIAYGKYFFKKSGYITKEWFPYFYIVRRKNTEFYEEYHEGNLSAYTKRIYEIIEENKELPLHLIKQYGGFGREEKSKFDAAITELQMKFYITMCGRARKKSKKDEEYGWSSTVFCLVEDFFEKEVLKGIENMTYDEAYSKIEEQVYQLNPSANEKKVKKFIVG